MHCHIKCTEWSRNYLAIIVNRRMKNPRWDLWRQRRLQKVKDLAMIEWPCCLPGEGATCWSMQDIHISFSPSVHIRAAAADGEVDAKPYTEHSLILCMLLPLGPRWETACMSPVDHQAYDATSGGDAMIRHRWRHCACVEKERAD